MRAWIVSLDWTKVEGFRRTELRAAAPREDRGLATPRAIALAETMAEVIWLIPEAYAVEEYATPICMPPTQPQRG